MTLYLPALTTEELIAYADVYAETDLEVQLLARFKAALNELDRDKK